MPTQPRLKKSETLEIRLPYPTKLAFMASCRAEGRSASEALRQFIDAELGQASPRGLSRRAWRLIAGAMVAGCVVAAALPSLARPSLHAEFQRAEFDRLDLNGDRVISAAEFARLDANHDGKVSYDEFRTFPGR
jgi:Ca2+-binding EF-hand superfamily protein